MAQKPLSTTFSIKGVFVWRISIFSSMARPKGTPKRYASSRRTMRSRYGKPAAKTAPRRKKSTGASSRGVVQYVLPSVAHATRKARGQDLKNYIPPVFLCRSGATSIISSDDSDTAGPALGPSQFTNNTVSTTAFFAQQQGGADTSGLSMPYCNAFMVNFASNRVSGNGINGLYMRIRPIRTIVQLSFPSDSIQGQASTNLSAFTGQAPTLFQSNQLLRNTVYFCALYNPQDVVSYQALAADIRAQNVLEATTRGSQDYSQNIQLMKQFFMAHKGRAFETTKTVTFDVEAVDSIPIMYPTVDGASVPTINSVMTTACRPQQIQANNSLTSGSFKYPVICMFMEPISSFVPIQPPIKLDIEIDIQVEVEYSDPTL